MRYYEAKFNLQPDTKVARDIVSALAADAGFESFEDKEDGLHGYVQVEAFDKDALDNAIKKLPLPDVKVDYEISEIPDEDWNSEWENNGFDPVFIDNRCVIYDAKHKGNLSGRENLPELQIGIEARQAFGTGTHETTQMIVGTLLDMDLKGKRVLDCGCGTGILGIVAAKRGAKEVVGYDIDDWSVRNAKHNAEINNVDMEVLEGDKGVLSHVCGVFDVVLANINRNILLADMESFVEVMSKEATLIMSGFYESDIDVLLEKASSIGLTEKGRKMKGDWCCLVLNRE